MSKEIKREIEERWYEWIGGSNLKPHHKQYKKLREAFFVGAIVALSTMEVKVPPIWELCIMTGRDPITTE